MHTYIHAHTHAHTHTHACMHTYTYTHTHTHMHTCTHANTHTCTHTPLSLSFLHTHTHTHARTHLTHTHAHTHTHTNTHTSHTHTSHTHTPHTHTDTHTSLTHTHTHHSHTHLTHKHPTNHTHTYTHTNTQPTPPKHPPPPQKIQTPNLRCAAHLMSAPHGPQLPVAGGHDDGGQHRAGHQVQQRRLARLHQVQRHARQQQPHQVGCNRWHRVSEDPENTGWAELGFFLVVYRAPAVSNRPPPPPSQGRLQQIALRVRKQESTEPAKQVPEVGCNRWHRVSEDPENTGRAELLFTGPPQ